MSRRHLKRLVFFAFLFALSMLSIFLIFYFDGNLAFPQQGQNGVGRPPDGDEGNPAEALALVLSIITAVASTGGFLFTTLFAFREDRRATERHELELASLQKELQQKDLVIERLSRKRREAEEA